MSPKAISALGELSSQLAGAVETAANSVVAIHARRRIPSSGIVWRDGVIVSASHTVRRDGDVSVTLPSGESATATVVGRDAATDLVALKVAGVKAHVAAKAASDAARVGSLVLAVGRPGRTASASFGIISGIGEAWRTWQGARIDRVLRLDLAVYDGFSGGPLIDAAGSVIGVDNSALARGAPLALPATAVDRVLDELLKHGHVRRAYIGVAVHPVALGASVVSRHKLPHDSALVVMSVADGSPAEAAGILVGDVLVEAVGRALRRPTDLLDELSNVEVGKALEIKHLRGTELKTVTVSPIDRADAGTRE
jgi:S1-C subfamily serine protease